VMWHPHVPPMYSKMALLALLFLSFFMAQENHLLELRSSIFLCTGLFLRIKIVEALTVPIKEVSQTIRLKLLGRRGLYPYPPSHQTLPDKF
jgi:hypothetical protein